MIDIVGFRAALVRIFGRRRGASGIEYGMLVGLIAIAALVGIANSGNSISSLFNAVCKKLNNISGASTNCGGGTSAGPVAPTGLCGATTSFASKPSGSSLCAAGTASGVSGIGDPLITASAWTWTCAGSTSTASCSATSSLDTCSSVATGGSCNRLKRDGSGVDPVYVVTANSLFAATTDSNVPNGEEWSTGYCSTGYTGASSSPNPSSYSYGEATGAACSGGGTYAAQVCYALGTANLTAYDQYDWYLPADSELLTMLTNIAGTSSTPAHNFFAANTSGAPGFYWSATEVDSNNAAVRYYSSGWTSFTYVKVGVLSVRCVRR